MKMLFIILMALTVTGCTRGCEDWDRKMQGDANYTIIQYSGGSEIGKWKFNGIVNSSEHSDGYYFTVNGKMVEVSGTLKIIRED